MHAARRRSLTKTPSCIAPIRRSTSSTDIADPATSSNPGAGRRASGSSCGTLISPRIAPQVGEPGRDWPDVAGRRRIDEQRSAGLRILLVEDDAIFAAVTAEVMRERALVRWTPTAESAIAAAGEKDWDLIITDIELPGMSGLELVMKIKAAQPHVATLILTGHRSFDNAVEAIRVGADDFLTKPVDRRTLIEKIDELAALSARRKAASSAAVLAIGAHPDDVEVGAGGTLLGHVAQGHEVSVLVLTGGDVGGMPGRARQARPTRAAELMGVRLFHVNLADSSVSEGGATIGEITRVIEEVQPDTIYTHSGQDLNQDHRNVHHATIVAARRVPRLFCYQTPVLDGRVPPDALRLRRRVHGPQARRDPLLHLAGQAAPLPRRRDAARDEPLLEPLRPLALRRAVRGRPRHRGRGEGRAAPARPGSARCSRASEPRARGYARASSCRSTYCRMPPWR